MKAHAKESETSPINFILLRTGPGGRCRVVAVCIRSSIGLMAVAPSQPEISREKPAHCWCPFTSAALIAPVAGYPDLLTVEIYGSPYRWRVYHPLIELRIKRLMLIDDVGANPLAYAFGCGPDRQFRAAVFDPHGLRSRSPTRVQWYESFGSRNRASGLSRRGG